MDVRTPPVPPAVAETDGGGRAAGRRWASIVQVVALGLLATLPVATVLGAVPGRRPTVLIEWMFRGFVRCALDGGALNPLVMACRRAGVPNGMYQLDGGLTYPLGGLAVRAGVTPLSAWKLAVVSLLAIAFVALVRLGQQLTGSVTAGGAVALLLAFDATLTARTWNWYWNTVAIALLAVLLLALLWLFRRASHLRVARLWAPGAAVTATVLLIGIEWQYAGLFAAAVAGGALVLLVAARGWTPRQRAALLTAGAVAGALVVGVLRWRLALAGISGQFDESLAVAADEGVDLLALVVPDAEASLLGWLLARITGARLVASVSDGHHLWIAPYLDVGLLAVVAVLYVRRRPGLDGNPRCPRGFLALLLATLVASVALSLGPVWHVARVTLPGVEVASPLGWLWTVTPLRWVRYPWTWNGVTTIVTLVGVAALLPALSRRPDRSWSPVVWVVLLIAVLELGSPLVTEALTTRLPSVATAHHQRTTGDPDIRRFERTAMPELRTALAEVPGPVMFLPWGNTWITPYLGAAAGVELRNVGIDRNVLRAEAAAPVSRDLLREGRAPTIDRLFDVGWVHAVALIDFVPAPDKIERAATGNLRPNDARARRRAAGVAREVERLGYCTQRYSWFTLVTEPTGERACTTRTPPPGRNSPSAAVIIRP